MEHRQIFSEEPAAVFEQAEELIREHRYQEALTLLKAMAEAEPENSRAAYDLGNIALLQDEYELAWNYYESALARGMESHSIYHNMAVAKEKTGELKTAERMFRQAAEKAGEQEVQWLALSALTLFYIRHSMLLKAEKTAGQVIEKFPNNYQGHHLYCLIMTERKDYDRLDRHFQEIREVFGLHPQYLIDRLASLEKEGKEDEVLKLINEDPAVMEAIPELALRKKVQILLKREERKEAKEIIDILFRDYKDPDAVIASIIIDMIEGNNARAGAAANVILDQEKETQGPRFFLAMYLQIFIFYAAYNGRPPEEVRDLMQREASLCVEWMEQNDLETTQMQESLSEVLHEVRN